MLPHPERRAGGCVAAKRICAMLLNDAARLRLLAAEVLTIGTGMTDPECKRDMMELAASYERLADHAEKRAAAPALFDQTSSPISSRSDVSDGRR
jgi:hypothetical protein